MRLTRRCYSLARNLTLLLVAMVSFNCHAAIYPLPPSGTDLIGALDTVTANQQDTLLDIAKRFNIGQKEISISNPGVDRWLPGENTQILLPTRYVLPDTPRDGVVLNIPEMRLYYYPSPGKYQHRTVETYPVSIGRMDWQTPLGDARIIAKTANPVWRPPESIKQEHAAAGDPLPDVVPAGPDNPLGHYAMRLNIPGYLIHGTNKSLGIGMRVTHGCVRMYPSDIQKLFPRIKIGTRVRIVNQPVKVGWYADALFLEVHPPLEEETVDANLLGEQAKQLIIAKTEGIPIALNDQQISNAIKQKTGVPVLIGYRTLNSTDLQHALEEG